MVSWRTQHRGKGGKDGTDHISPKVRVGTSQMIQNRFDTTLKSKTNICKYTINTSLDVTQNTKNNTSIVI